VTLDQKASRQHWDENLDPQNLQAEAGARDLQTEWEFYTSDEALFAQSHFPPLKNAIALSLARACARTPCGWRNRALQL